MKINRFLAVLTATVMTLTFNSCSKNQKDSEKIQIVASTFPVYDWCRQIIGKSKSFELSMLIENGTELHSFQPSVKDIMKIKNADLFIYTGGESDSWLGDVITAESIPSEHISISLMERLKDYVVEEEMIDGMQEEEKSDGPEYDEHVWLSLDNAQYICQFITDALIALDKDNTDIYTENCREYTAQISELKSEYSNIFSQCRNKTIIICDRFPFRYLTDEFGISYLAAFSGCSTDAEAGFKTISTLSDKLRELNKNVVFRLENSTNRLCETVIRTAQIEDCKIVSLDSMQSTTLEQAENGKNYIETMRYNLSNIAESVK